MKSIAKLAYCFLAVVLPSILLLSCSSRYAIVEDFDITSVGESIMDTTNYSSEETPEDVSKAVIVFEDIPVNIYEFAVTYMKAREISNVEARRYVRYFGDNADFMMEAW